MTCRSFAAMALLALPAFCQSPIVLRSGEAIFTVSVRGGNGVQFRGSCLSTPGEGAAVTTELKGTVPAEFTICGDRDLPNSPESLRREGTRSTCRDRWVDGTRSTIASRTGGIVV